MLFNIAEACYDKSSFYSITRQVRHPELVFLRAGSSCSEKYL
jgi:hypothetical protein